MVLHTLQKKWSLQVESVAHITYTVVLENFAWYLILLLLLVGKLKGAKLNM